MNDPTDTERQPGGRPVRHFNVPDTGVWYMTLEDRNALVLNTQWLVHVILRKTYPDIIKLIGGREDAVQTAQLALVRASRGYQPERGKFATYAGHAIRRELMNLLTALRTQKRSGRTVQLESEPIFRDDYEETPDFSRLHAAIRSLRPQDRKLIRQRYWHGQNHRKIARRAGITHQGVAYKFHRIYRTLAFRLRH